MKRIWLVWLMLFCVLTVSAVAQANSQEETVTITVPKSSLTPQQKQLTAQENAKSWIGIGEEFGHAVNAGLAAVTEQSNNFAKTPVGKLTVYLIAWKILGDQLLHIIGGAIFGIVFLILWIWSYRRMCLPRKILVKETILPDKSKVREWKVVNDSAAEPTTKSSYGNTEIKETDGWRIAHIIIGAILLGVVLITMFSY